MVHFRYAKSEKGEKVDIDSIKRNQGKYLCIGCDNEVIPHFIGETGHHFQHKAYKKCSPETYLHKLAKITFYSIYSKCISDKEPFYIEFTQIKECQYYKGIFDIECSQTFQQKINIIDYFNEIAIEEKEGQFVPDIKLFNMKTNEQLFIEFKVTHKSSLDKITSKYRIIEISIFCEENINSLKGKYIIENPGKIWFYNFKRNIADNCHGNCREIFYFLSLDNHGKASMIERNLKQVNEIIKNNNTNKIIKFKITYKNYLNGYKIYKDFINECKKERLNIKNCFFCKFVELYTIQDDDESYSYYWKRIPGQKGLFVSCNIFVREDKRHCNYALKCPDYTMYN